MDVKMETKSNKAWLKKEFFSPSILEEWLRLRAFQVRESPVNLGYSLAENWPNWPRGWEIGSVGGVSSTHDRYYVAHRGKNAPSILCFDREGKLIDSWGEGVFTNPHMIKCDKNDNIWVIDSGDNVLYLFSPDGDIIKILGTKGVPGEDDCHFNKPTDIAFSLDDGVYVSDGYGNNRIVRFDNDLQFLSQWGSKGTGEGQFNLPHAITTDGDGIVYVADRANWRVELFTPTGDYIRQWTHIGYPDGIVYSEDGFIYVCDGNNYRITKLDLHGNIIGFLGEAELGFWQLNIAHDITVTEEGEILVALLEGGVKLFVIN